MAVADVLPGAIPESTHRTQLRRAVIASTVGTTIEWYDFLLYSVVTGLVFAKLFFPKSDPLVGVLEAFAIYFVGFIARPIGAAIFGHYGDRIGRKGALIATLLLTGLATFAVGVVPTYDSIGVWGGHSDRDPLHPRDWCRRRMGRLGAAVDGMGPHQQASRLHLLLATIGWPWRSLARQSGGVVLQLAFRRPVPRLGLEDTVPAQHRNGGRGALHPAGHPGNAGVPATACGEADRAGAGLGGDQAAAQGDHSVGSGAHG